MEPGEAAARTSRATNAAVNTAGPHLFLVPTSGERQKFVAIAWLQAGLVPLGGGRRQPQSIDPVTIARQGPIGWRNK